MRKLIGVGHSAAVVELADEGDVGQEGHVAVDRIAKRLVGGLDQRTQGIDAGHDLGLLLLAVLVLDRRCAGQQSLYGQSRDLWRLLLP